MIAEEPIGRLGAPEVLRRSLVRHRTRHGRPRRPKRYNNRWTPLDGLTATGWRINPSTKIITHNQAA
jgi:hypothetical protein